MTEINGNEFFEQNIMLNEMLAAATGAAFMVCRHKITPFFE